jgi:hypothetical protein
LLAWQHDLKEAFAEGDLEGAVKLTVRMKYLSKFAEEASIIKARMAR